MQKHNDLGSGNMAVGVIKLIEAVQSSCTYATILRLTSSRSGCGETTPRYVSTTERTREGDNSVADII